MIKDHPIYLESIKFIRSKLNDNDFNYLENRVLERLVHTSGDFNVQKLLEFSEGACEKAVQSLKEGAPILTDTDMAASAIKSMAKNTSGNLVFSAKNWPNGENLSGLTQTAYGIEKGWLELSGKYLANQSPIIVIGSSPTALINLIEILNNSKIIPSLIIGMPVGFIGVRQSKKKLLETNYPRIVVNSSRGGAAMAAAAVNALLRETV